MSELEQAAEEFRRKWGFHPRPAVEDIFRRGEFDLEGGTEDERSFIREVLTGEAEPRTWPASISADITMADGRVVHVPDVPLPAPVSSGKVQVSIPWPDSEGPGLVASIAVTNEALPVTFRRDIYPYEPYLSIDPGDTLHVELTAADL